MIEHEVVQGSPEWLALRMGIPTASEFDQIITPAKGELSKSARPYMMKLLAEWCLGESMDDISNLEWVERGKELEPEAVRFYEFTQGVKTRAVGFITTDDGRCGASPDRLIIGVAAGVEIKCPKANTHAGYYFDGFGEKYKVQVQGQMYVGQLEYVERYSYFPKFTPKIERTYRDGPFIRKMGDALTQFCDELDALKVKARELGWYQDRDAIKTAVDVTYGANGSPYVAPERDWGPGGYMQA
jgi:hypothetical protein